MDRIRIRLSIIAIIFVTTGCTSDVRILERVGFTHTTSYDLLPNNKLKISISIPKTEQAKSVSREVLTTTANSSKEARINLSRQTSRQIVSGQLRNTLFGLDLAKKGLWNYIDTLVRDTSISSRVKVTVVNGEAHEMLAKNYAEHPRTGQYIDRLLEKEIKGHSIAKVSLFEFARDYYDDGIDPVAPLVRDGGKHVILDGIALFRGDQYAMRVPTEKGIIFSFLRRDFKQGEISVELNKTEGALETVMFSSLTSKRKIKVDHGSNGQVRVTIDVKVRGSVLEYIGDLKLNNTEERHELEERISRHISNQAEDLVREMQMHQVDSIGIGSYVRNSMTYNSWKAMNWKEEYPKAEVTCKFNVTIKDYGKFK